MLNYDESGNVVEDGQPNFAWVDNNVEPLKIIVNKAPPAWVDATPSPLQNPDASPAEIAAYRLANSTKRPDRGPVEKIIIPEQDKRPSYVMEPDLQEAQGGMYLPPGLMQEDSGRMFYKDDPTKTIPMIRRPNLIPVAFTPEGLKPVMPKLLDLLGNVGSPLIAGRVPVKAGEMVLGSGAVRTAVETAKEADKIATPFYSALEKAVEGAKVEKADASQWLGYLRNQPGVKAEEINTVLKELPEGQITKDQLDQIVKQNKVELKEKVLGGDEILKQQTKYDEAMSMARRQHVSSVRNFEKVLKEAGGDVNDELVKEAGQMLEVATNRITELKNNKPSASPTKYHQYQLPGGENYKEMLMKLPEKMVPNGRFVVTDGTPTFNMAANTKSEAQDIINNMQKHSNKPLSIVEDKMPDTHSNYQSSHWDEPNILAHIRMNDRNIEGKKVLHLEEIQSDWHQAGRKQGYKLTEGQKKDLENIDEKLTSKLSEADIGNPDIDAVLKTAVEKKVISPEEAKNYKEYSKGENSNIPDAPFKKNWDELALKRMIHHASKNGYEGISWTPGEAQAARYDLSKQIEEVQYYKSNGRLLAVDKNGNSVIDKAGLKEKDLVDYIGKEAAEKLLNNPTSKENKGDIHILSNQDLKIGGEGMKSFYDKMLVDRANALGKKYGAKVEQKEISVDPNIKLENMHPDFRKGYGIKIHYLPITPELRQKAKEGFPLFSSVPVTVPVDYTPEFKDKPKHRLVPVSHTPVFE